MTTLQKIRNKYQIHDWSVLSDCCHAPTEMAMIYDIDDAYEACSKCKKKCTSSHQNIPEPKIVEIPGTNRETFAKLLTELDLNLGVEMGVEQGLYSEILCKANPNIELYSVDAWTAYKGYRDHVSQEKLDGFLEITKNRLKPYRATVIKGFSMDVVKQFKDESLDFVYIDGNHEYQATVNDICEWQKKVKVGGIVSGHDYILRKDNGYLMHVPMAVNGYCESYNIAPLFILGKKTDPKPPEGIRDTARSWFYVKPDRSRIVPGSGYKLHQ